MSDLHGNEPAPGIIIISQREKPENHSFGLTLLLPCIRLGQMNLYHHATHY